jgi:hypothetical protein
MLLVTAFGVDSCDKQCPGLSRSLPGSLFTQVDELVTLCRHCDWNPARGDEEVSVMLPDSAAFIVTN